MSVKRRNIMILARKISVILLVILGIIILISGIMLETEPKGPGSGEAIALGISKETWSLIHIYASFTLAGVAIVHAYTNYRAILYHLGITKLLSKTRSNKTK